MKRAMVAVVGMVVVWVGLALAADPDTVWREAMRTVVTTNGLAVKTDTNVVSVASTRAPAFAGQWLFGTAGTGTNAVWVAKGLTTNDWVQLKP